MTIHSTSTEAGTIKEAIRSQQKNRMVTMTSLPDGVKTLDGDIARMSTYGIVDPAGRVMEPLYDAVMTPLEKNSENPKMLMNFVADQYLVFKSKFEERSNKNSSYGILTPTSAAVRGDVLYQDYIKNLVESLVQVIFQENRASISSFREFCHKFLQLVKRSGSTPIGGGLPITKTKFYTSTQVPMNISGLVVEFSSAPMNEKQYHYESWINDVNFQLYCSLASDQGFFIDRKYPFRLIANLASEKMKVSAEFYGADYLSIDFGTAAFSEFYHNVSLLDFIELKNALFAAYSRFTSSNPFIISARPCSNRGIVRKKVRREVLNLKLRNRTPFSRVGGSELEDSYEPIRFSYGLHDEKYGILFFLDLYIKVRYYEILDRPNKVFRSRELRNIYNEARLILIRSGSVLSAFSFVEKKFRGFRLIAH